MNDLKRGKNKEKTYFQTKTPALQIITFVSRHSKVHKAAINY